MQRGDYLSVKIKISYEEQQELQMVMKLLSPVIKKPPKVAKAQKGKYKNAYIDIEAGTKPEGTGEAKVKPERSLEFQEGGTI